MPHDRHRPHHVIPCRETIRVVLVAKNFAAIVGCSHIGLGVTALNTQKVLRRDGVYTEVWALQTAEEVRTHILAAEERAYHRNQVPITHVIVSAPWLHAKEYRMLCHEFPDIEFVLLNHSGAAFLSIDKNGIQTNRECLHLEMHTHNFRVAANNPRVANFFRTAFNAPCLLLPNLYDTESFVRHYPHHHLRQIGGTLRIGSFGAGRPWKNQLCAAEAAVMIARQLGLDLELYVNSKRPDGGERMIESRRELFHNLRGCRLIEVPWEPWAQFRKTVANMHLLLQPSFDETFNVVTADGIAEGVPSVTSSSIEWTPRDWQSDTCDPGDIARVGIALLHNNHAVEHARDLLRRFVHEGLHRWERYLLRQPEHC